MSGDLNEYLENILQEVGGFGKFQFVLLSVVFVGKIATAWSTIMMTYGGAVPEWQCTWDAELKVEHLQNTSFAKVCELKNDTVENTCGSFTYDSKMSTVVSEWNLVCDNDWIISTITTIQMGGVLVGSLTSGQFSDIFGRKPAFFISLTILLISNAIAALSVNWQMFAVLRFFIGIGCGWFLTVNIIVLAEFTPAKYRSIVLAIPIWSLGSMLFGLFAWFLHDWMYIQIATAVCCILGFSGLFPIPESYRWLASNKQTNRAHNAIRHIAKLNGRSAPSKEGLCKVMEQFHETSDMKKYTVLDLIRNRKLLKRTIVLLLCEVSCGYGYYAISFGVQQLSGNLYVNIILLGLMDVVSVTVSFIANKIGRKKTVFLFFIVTGITGIAVGVIQFLDISDKGRLLNGLALTSKLCLNTGWIGLIIFISEIYPTVVRNVGFGLCEATARVGAMVAPQLVFASKHIPGISYLLLGGLFTMSAFCVLLLKETNKMALKDTIEQIIEPPQHQQKTDNSDSIYVIGSDFGKLELTTKF